MSAAREPRLLIGAKPMVGDPAYDVAPLVLQLASPTEAPEPERVLLERIELLAEHPGEPVEPLAPGPWRGLAKSVAW